MRLVIGARNKGDLVCSLLLLACRCRCLIVLSSDSPPVSALVLKVMIVYAVICRSRDAAVLCENYTPELGGNAPQVSMALMERLRDHPEYLASGESKTFAQRNEETDFFAFTSFLEACTGGAGDATMGDHFFHVMHDGTVYFSCLSDDPDPRSHAVAFKFLNHVKDEFRSLYKERRIKRAHAYGLDKDFGPHLRSAMHYYNSNLLNLAREAKVEGLREQVESMKLVMGRNINLLLQRGEQLDALEEKSKVLMEDTEVFKKRSSQLKSHMWWQYYKTSCLLMFLVVGVIWLIFSSICGFNFSRCMPSNSSSSSSGG